LGNGCAILFADSDIDFHGVLLSVGLVNGALRNSWSEANTGFFPALLVYVKGGDRENLFRLPGQANGSQGEAKCFRSTAWLPA
ncbi:hypothetical protein ABTA25_19340, partial [Acinetobacter baumannii]